PTTTSATAATAATSATRTNQNTPSPQCVGASSVPPRATARGTPPIVPCGTRGAGAVVRTAPGTRGRVGWDGATRRAGGVGTQAGLPAGTGAWMLRLGRREFGPRESVIMAIVNRTPDSFYDRGATFDEEP